MYPLKVKVKAAQWCLTDFSRQEYWSRLPISSPGDLPNPEIEPRSPTLQADSLPAEPPGNVSSNSLIISRMPWSY